MASHIGLIFRNEKAQARVDTALAAIRASGVDIPESPSKTRDPKENDTLNLEWLAEALEAVETTVRKPAAKAKPAAKGDK